MDDQKVVRVLSYLYEIVEAGEKGYAVSAVHLDNPGLKLLFKSFAQQRAGFKTEILSEIKRLGGNRNPGNNIRGTIHRGRIAIFAALTIGKLERERVVLKEAELGEKSALHVYERTLKEELPSITRRIVTSHYEQVRRLVEQIHLMRGTPENRLIVHLFEKKEHVARALDAIEDSGYHPTGIEQINIQETLDLYESKDSIVLETSISGAVGGALWGTLIGVLAGAGVGYANQYIPVDVMQTPYAGLFVALAIIIGGALIGTILGFVIGIGIAEEDTYLYDQGREKGKIILMTVMENSQFTEAQQIISQFNLASKIEEGTGNLVSRQAD